MRKYSIILLFVGILFFVGMLSFASCVTQGIDIPVFTSLPGNANLYFSLDVQAEPTSAVQLIQLFLPDIQQNEIEKLLPRLRKVYIALYDESMFIWLEASIPSLALSAILRESDWDQLARNFWNSKSLGLNIQVQRDGSMLIYSERFLNYESISSKDKQFLDAHSMAALIYDTQSYITTAYTEEIEVMRLNLSEKRTLLLEMDMSSETVAKLALVFSRLLVNSGELLLIDGMRDSITRTGKLVHVESAPLNAEQLSDIMSRLLEGKLVAR